MQQTKEVYCCGCEGYISARLTDGAEIYPHREDLYNLPFWKCDTCKGFVGCHHKTKNRTAPLGCIPTKRIKNARKKIHAILDPLWQNNLIQRKKIYAMLTEHLGWKYHTAKIRTEDEARQVYNFILELREKLHANNSTKS